MSVRDCTRGPAMSARALTRTRQVVKEGRRIAMPESPGCGVGSDPAIIDGPGLIQE